MRPDPDRLARSSAPSSTRRKTAVAGLAAALAAAVVCVGGCSRAIDGTAVATPGQAGVAARADTVCRDYVAMSEQERRDVIVAIAESGSKILAAYPETWVTAAAALCGLVGPNTKVKDVLPGGTG